MTRIRACHVSIVRCHKLVDDSDRGSLALWMAVMATAMLAMLGLVVDGGNALATRERAADVATQAARAGADALAPGSLRAFEDGQSLAVDPSAATVAANKVLAAAGATGQVTVSGSSVAVTARIHKQTAILSAVGVDDISQSASATATAVYGSTVPIPIQEGG